MESNVTLAASLLVAAAVKKDLFDIPVGNQDETLAKLAELTSLLETRLEKLSRAR